MIHCLRTSCWFLVAAMAVYGLNANHLQAQIYTPLSSNGQFTTGSFGWNVFGAGASVTDQGPQSIADFDQFGYPVFGENKLELSGPSFAWQLVTLTPGAKYHQLNCQAFKESLDGNAPGWAGYGIIYYDVLFGVIDSFEKQIYTAGFTSSTPFSPSSLGVRVPVDATYAIIWASNDAQNTRSSFDALTLFDYEKASYNTNVGPYLGSTQPGSFEDTLGNLHLQSGLQFWNLSGCIDVGTGSIGDVGQACSMAQEIDVTVGKEYIGFWYSDVARPGNLPVANFGVDFFDAQWERIDGVYSSLVDGNTTEFQFRTPEGTAHAVVWVWVDALDSLSERLSPPYINVSERDVTAPNVSLRFALPNITRSAIGLDFEVSYADDLTFVNYNLLSQALELRGPNGKTYVIDYVGNGGGGNGNNLLTLQFGIVPADFSWANEPLGDYEIWLTDTGISDGAGNATTSRSLGGFKLTAPVAASRAARRATR